VTLAPAGVGRPTRRGPPGDRRWLPLIVPPALVAFLLWRPATTGPTICPFALVTGHACPLCGGTRAAAAVVRGDWAAAWDLHPLVFLALPAMAVAWGWWLGATRGWWAPVSVRATNRIMAVLGILGLAVWLARLISGTLPPV
jgi:hypothetical protein